MTQSTLIQPVTSGHGDQRDAYVPSWIGLPSFEDVHARGTVNEPGRTHQELQLANPNATFAEDETTLQSTLCTVAAAGGSGGRRPGGDPTQGREPPSSWFGPLQRSDDESVTADHVNNCQTVRDWKQLSPEEQNSEGNIADYLNASRDTGYASDDECTDDEDSFDPEWLRQDPEECHVTNELQNSALPIVAQESSSEVAVQDPEVEAEATAVSEIVMSFMPTEAGEKLVRENQELKRGYEELKRENIEMRTKLETQQHTMESALAQMKRQIADMLSKPPPVQLPASTADSKRASSAQESRVQESMWASDRNDDSPATSPGSDKGEDENEQPGSEREDGSANLPAAKPKEKQPDWWDGTKDLRRRKKGRDQGAENGGSWTDD